MHFYDKAGRKLFLVITVSSLEYRCANLARDEEKMKGKKYFRTFLVRGKKSGGTVFGELARLCGIVRC